MFLVVLVLLGYVGSPYGTQAVWVLYMIFFCRCYAGLWDSYEIIQETCVNSSAPPGF